MEISIFPGFCCQFFWCQLISSWSFPVGAEHLDLSWFTQNLGCFFSLGSMRFHWCPRVIGFSESFFEVIEPLEIGWFYSHPLWKVTMKIAGVGRWFLLEKIHDSLGDFCVGEKFQYMVCPLLKIQCGWSKISRLERCFEEKFHWRICHWLKTQTQLWRVHKAEQTQENTSKKEELCPVWF